MDQRDDPSNPSSAYGRMQDAWKTIDDILDGPSCIRAEGKRYLPKNPAETEDEFRRRNACAPWQPEFADIVQSLSSKPFGKEVGLKEGASARIKALAEDIDGKGNNLTAFCRPVFRSGVAKGCHAILVDNTGRGTARTQAEERAAGVRPYWVSIRAEDIIDLKTAFVNGREQPYHVRVKECLVQRDGYAETAVERIRELNREPAYDARGEIIALGPPTWVLHEKQRDASGKESWVIVQEGAFAPLTEIPLALFWTGEKEGPQFCRPPLYAIADKQIELYRALSRNEEAFYSVGYPMYAANGMGPPTDGSGIETGPNRILYAPGEGASWSIISADPDSLQVLLEDVDKRTDAIRRLGMQPLTQKTGGVTATASSIEGAKAHSTVQAWAVGFKDVLEQAFVFTSQWLGEEASVEVNVHTDFLAGMTDQPSLDSLNKARDRKDISRRAYLEGLIRFGVLPPDFDIEADDELIAEELEGLEPEEPAAEQIERPPPRFAA
jgi:hypothetical protein